MFEIKEYYVKLTCIIVFIFNFTVFQLWHFHLILIPQRIEGHKTYNNKSDIFI